MKTIVLTLIIAAAVSGSCYYLGYTDGQEQLATPVVATQVPQRAHRQHTTTEASQALNARADEATVIMPATISKVDNVPMPKETVDQLAQFEEMTQQTILRLQKGESFDAIQESFGLQRVELTEEQKTPTHVRRAQLLKKLKDQQAQDAALK